MPGVLLAVQLPQDVDRAVAGVHVEDSVHVGAPVDGVPAAQHTRGRKIKNGGLGMILAQLGARAFFSPHIFDTGSVLCSVQNV